MNHELHLRIYYEYTDAQGVVYYANYLRYFERARTEYLRDIGYGQKKLMQEGSIFIVRHVNIDFLRPATLDDNIVIKTKLIKLGRVSFDFSQDVYSHSEEALCKAIIQCGCLDIEKFKPTSLPPYLLKGMKSLM